MTNQMFNNNINISRSHIDFKNIPYKPLIGYNWSVITTIDNKKELVDYGMKPQVNGTMYFGRGAALDGDTQSLDVDTSNAANIYVFLDGTLTHIDVSSVDTYSFTTSQVIQNIIITNLELSDSLFEYLSKYPEKFLYHVETIHDDDSSTWTAKSEILSDDELSDIVQHYPMTDTDEFVRGMIGYSEGELHYNNTRDGYTSTDYFKPVVASAIINDDGTVRVQDTADNTNTPRIVLSNTPTYSYDSTDYCLENDTYYKVEFGIQGFSQKPAYIDLHYNADTNGNGGIIVRMYPSDETNYNYTGSIFLSEANNSGKSGICVLVAFPSPAGDYSETSDWFDLEYFVVTKLTSVNQFTNYTQSIRDDALNLQYGLQTCYLERDELGVPTDAKFDRLICDGVGYVDTNLIIDSSTNFQLEFITMFYDQTISTSYLGDYGNWGTTRLTIGKGSKGNVVYCAIGNNRSSIDGLMYKVNTFNSGKYSHCILQRDYESGINYLYVNGEFIGSETSDFDGMQDSFKLFVDKKFNGEVTLLKFHTTPQNPVELYNEAVRKGLLDD